MVSTTQPTTIPELSLDDLETFSEKYYRTEQPVIFRGVVDDQRSADEIRQSMVDRIAGDNTVTPRLLWFDVRPELVDGVCETPEVVSQSLDESTAFLRRNCVRVWFNPGGHATPWHYDGHSLHVFNLQIKGKKHWKIVAPETPLTTMPFSKTCIFENDDLGDRRYYEFDLNPGDMVFLPRYWFHHVQSMGDMNVNVNWVLMARQPPADTQIARREAEIIWLLRKLRPILPANNKWMLDNFAGVGSPALDVVTQDVGLGRGLMRAIKEIGRVPLILFAIPTQIRKIKTVLKSKRTLKQLMAQRGNAAAM